MPVENLFSKRDAGEDWAKPHERENEVFECMTVRRSFKMRKFKNGHQKDDLKTVKKENC